MAMLIQYFVLEFPGRHVCRVHAWSFGQSGVVVVASQTTFFGTVNCGQGNSEETNKFDPVPTPEGSWLGCSWQKPRSQLEMGLDVNVQHQSFNAEMVSEDIIRYYQI